MPELHDLKDDDLQGLAPQGVVALAQQMLQRLRRQNSEIKFKDAKIQKITFELARLRACKSGAKTEAISAEQRRLFEETLVEDEASLQAQLEQARGKPTLPAVDSDHKRKPRRQPLHDHLRRVEYHHEPEDTTCPSPGCDKTTTRVGEDVSERLDTISAEVFVHRHIYGKCACRCCQCLVQEAAVAQDHRRRHPPRRGLGRPHVDQPLRRPHVVPSPGVNFSHYFTYLKVPMAVASKHEESSQTEAREK